MVFAVFYCLGSIIGVCCFLHLFQVLGRTWAQCLMDVTPDAIVSEVFVEVPPKILETKAADMAGERNKPWKESSPAEFWFGRHLRVGCEGLNRSTKQSDSPKRGGRRVDMAVYLNLLLCFQGPCFLPHQITAK